MEQIKKENLKIAVIYTGMPAYLVDSVESEIKKALNGRAVTFLTLSDPRIIADAVENGSPSPLAARRLYSLYHMAIAGGADIVYNGCSSVGDIADEAKIMFKRIGVPFVRIDENMAQRAVREYKRIGVLATLPSTLAPTKRLVARSAQEAARTVTIVDALADKAFGVPLEQQAPLLIEKAMTINDDVDCFVLAQGSMAICRAAIEEATGKPVYDSPRYGAMAIAQIAEDIK